MPSFGLRFAWIILALTPVTTLAEREPPWLATRALSADELTALAESDDEASREARVRAQITLSDYALNQSVDKARVHLEAAEAELSPATDAAYFALAIRCQLEHRQGLPQAATSCAPIIDESISSDNTVVDAYLHATLMYYYYREGDHVRSLEDAEKVLDLASKVGDYGLLAAANNMIGLHFGTKLLPRMSLPHFDAAWQNARELAFPEFKMIIQLNLASSYTYLGRADEALQMLEEAKMSPVVDLYPTRRLVVQSMITQARVAANEIDGAQAALRDVMTAVQDTVLPDAMTFGYTGLGLIQLAEGQADEALNSFEQVLEITGEDFETGLEHPRIQLMVVPYAAALRESGDIDASRELLELVTEAIPSHEPDQLLVDANKELALTLDAAGRAADARAISERAARIESQLWDASFEYQVARLNASLENDRRKIELERAQEREIALREKAEREVLLRRQTWLLGAMIIAVIFLMLSRRLQKRLADTERAANARLEDQVKARTQELEDEMAKRMEVEIERRRLMEKMYVGEKLRALGQLTAGVAHDFNNLMTVVTLGADQLGTRLAKYNDEQTSEVLRYIVEAADTGAKITRGLLAYVRKQPLRPEVFGLDGFLENALPLFRNTLGERIEFSTQFEPCHVMADKGQLTTSILNLLLNAKESMPSGGQVWLTVRAIEGRAEIEVRDAGGGMTEEVRKQAFDPFFTTKEKAEGTGLGLSMVYGFARQSNGDLVIASQLHKGTMVTLSLPLVTSEMAQAEASPPVPARMLRKVRVLAVEDREILLRVLEPALEQLGMDVSTASSAAQALELVAANGLPDLLISDIVMPGELDGVGLVAELRQRDANLPVVLMSGFSKSVDDECTFLRKPFSVAELEEAIAKTLRSADATTMPA